MVTTRATTYPQLNINIGLKFTGLQHRKRHAGPQLIRLHTIAYEPFFNNIMTIAYDLPNQT
jgi:hypothetical protein